MKKFILCMALMLPVGSQVLAQYSQYYYHRTGDTIEWKSEIGYYTWWEFVPFFEQNLIVNVGNRHSAEGLIDSAALLMKFHTPTPLKIIGIAGTGFRGRFQPNSDYIPDTNMFQEYYLIYDACNTGLTLKAQVPWSPFDPSRTLHVKTHQHISCEGCPPPSDSCCDSHTKDFFLPIREYYLDSAIYVIDSFYVGGSYFGNAGSWLTGIPSSDSIKTRYFYANTIFSPGIACNTELQDATVYQYHSCFPQGVHMKWKEKTESLGTGSSGYPLFSEKPWEDADKVMTYIMLVYPIIEVDTTMAPVNLCPPISNVQVSTSSTTATVTWDNYPYYSSMLLSYGQCNVPQNQWQTVDISDRSLYVLSGLEPQACYKLKMKALCDTCKKETEWSEPISFYTTDGGDDSLGIANEPTALAQFTFISPNPARHEIVVNSGFNLQEIDIWTLDGVWVHHQSIVGHQATVPIDFLRPGTYIVAIHTHEGTTHKKLLVR